MADYLGFPPTDEERYFFISYSSEDHLRLAPIASELSKSIPLWYDNGLNYNEQWSEQIANRIEHAEAVILFFSKSILQKGTTSFVYKEYLMARSFFQRTIYVVFLEDVTRDDIPNSLLSWWIELISYQCLYRKKFQTDSALIDAIIAATGFRVIHELRLLAKDGQVYTIHQGANYLGREKRKVNIPISPSIISVSRIHCCITLQNSRLFIQDLGAAYGTSVNKRKLQRMESCELFVGDVIALGDYELTVAY